MPKRSRICPICEGGQTAFFASKAGHDFSKCEACGFIYIDPEIPQAALAPIYSAQPASNRPERYPFDKARHRRRRAWLRAWRLARYFRAGDAIDIGCGGGFMVDAMQRQGARAVGLDLDPEAIAFASANHHPEARFYCEALSGFEARGLSFDFGHSSQVIEHVGEVNEFVAAWARLIRPGGWFYLKTPDRDHWRTGRKPADWPDPPAYVQYFNRASIKLLLERHGFEVRRMFFDFKPSIQLLARRREGG